MVTTILTVVHNLLLLRRTDRLFAQTDNNDDGR